MFQESFLFNPDGPDLPMPEQRLGRALGRLRGLCLVVPRHLCVYQRFSCAGVPRLKLASFVGLQLQSISPFARYGACVTRQGDVLHAWLWDAAIESEFSAKHGGQTRFVTKAQSLFSRSVVHGVVWLKAGPGLDAEAQLWKGGALVDSLWFSEVPDGPGWSQRLANSPDLVAMGWPDTLPSLAGVHSAAPANRAWGRNEAPNGGVGFSVEWNRLIPAGLFVCTLVLFGWGSWVLSQKLAHESAIQAVQSSQEQRLAELEPLQLAKAYTQGVAGWVQGVASLGSTKTTSDLLLELADLFGRQGLIVRELEINEPTVQVTLVGLGSEAPRLTAVIGALESHSGFYDAKFVDVVGGNGFKFSWRMRAAVPAMKAGVTPR